MPRPPSDRVQVTALYEGSDVELIEKLMAEINTKRPPEWQASRAEVIRSLVSVALATPEVVTWTKEAVETSYQEALVAAEEAQEALRVAKAAKARERRRGA